MEERSTSGNGGDLTFERAQAELEHIVDRLERGEVPLDDAIALWQRGEELYRFCVHKLDTAQGEVEELARGGATGS